MRNQKGFTLVEGLLIVLIMCVVGFAGYYAWTQNQDDEVEQTETAQQEERTEQLNNEDTSSNTEVVSNNNFSSDELGFSFQYPLNLVATEPVVKNGYENAGRTLYLTLDDDIFIKSNTSDYSIGPKGPIPLSGIAANGYIERDGKIYYSDGTSELTADKVESKDNYIFIENRVLFQPDDNTVEYIALFNTSNGGLAIYTENSEKVDIVEKIAESVETK